MPQTIFIIGSCVTRDAFAVVPNEYEVIDYFARSSLASAFQVAPFRRSLDELDPEQAIKSQFQRKMVERDLSRALPEVLANLDDDTTVVLDLIDERFALLCDDGSLATFSVELQLAKPLERYPDLTLVRPHTDQHFNAWIEGAESFVDLVRRRELKLIVNEAYWAETSAKGHVFPRDQVARSNAGLARMYGMLRAKLRCPAITYGPLIADDDHKWGLSAFHYMPAAYRVFMDQLDSLSADFDRRRSRPEVA